MIWIAAFAFFGFCWCRAAKARERAAELAATGTGRSPLYWVSNALVAILLALVLYIAMVSGKERNSNQTDKRCTNIGKPIFTIAQRKPSDLKMTSRTS
ncbi:hypothetical protein ABIG06_006425 [Bradyrhizobium sp. USDA 326]|uniref:hypothetical protein n=1 Tax=unclassified Bradyrhizobium TaxID=2631580 RepID=UPI003513D8C4